MIRGKSIAVLVELLSLVLVLQATAALLEPDCGDCSGHAQILEFAEGNQSESRLETLVCLIQIDLRFDHPVHV